MSDKNRQQILIVEDNEDVRNLLQQLLEEEERYDLFLAATGTEALKQAIEVQPDLILMDMSLPEISGWEAVMQIRQIPALAQTPILALTAHASQADQERALAVGCTAHLGKPFELFAILEMIENLLSS